MLTNGFYSVLVQHLVGKDAAVKTTSGVQKNLYTTDGQYFPYFGRNVQYAPYLGVIRTSYKNGVVFGDGDTPVMPEDYKLAGNIITTLTGSAAIASQSVANGVGQIKVIYTLTNSGDSPVTIKEVAAIALLRYSSDYYMVDRTVLDEPVTIPAGGIGQVVYTITFNYPTAAAPTN